MTRLLFLGNSHLAAIKDASTRYADRFEGVEITCVGAHKMGLLDTDVQGSILRPATESAREAFRTLGGVSEVDLKSYDAVTLCGCGMAFSRALWLWRKARWFDLPSASSTDGSDWTLISRAAYDAMLQSALVDVLAGRLLRHLRRATDRPILVASQPRTAEAVLTTTGNSLSAHKPLLNQGDAPAVNAAFEWNADLVCEALGGRFLSQPAQSVTQDVLTRETFTNGAVRLSAQGRYAQPEDDLLHANAAYGALVIKQVVEAVA